MAILDLPPAMWDLIGVFLGVTLGQLLTMWWDRRKQSLRDSQALATTEESLVSELREIRDNVASCEDLGIPDIAFPTGAYQSSLSSGRFGLLDQEDQLDVTEIYSIVERTQADQEQLREARLTPGIDETDLRNLQFQFEDRINTLESKIPLIIDQLQEQVDDHSQLQDHNE